MYGYSTPKAIREIRIGDAGVYEIALCCGGKVLADMLALSPDEVAIWTMQVRCNCGKGDCEWNKSLKVEE